MISPIHALARRPRLAITLLAFAGYLAIGRGVRNLYPFSTFDMYSDEHVDSGSRVVARTADGAIHEVTSYRAWRCDAPPEQALSIRPSACPDVAPYYYIPYVDRAARTWIVEHATTELDARASRVDVIRRIWRLGHGGGAPRFEDCLLLACSAVPR